MPYTIVQHSAYGYNYNPQFRRGLETRHVDTKADQAKVSKAGGVLMDYLEAEELARIESYPASNNGLIPSALGTFARAKVDGLRIYVPINT